MQFSMKLAALAILAQVALISASPASDYGNDYDNELAARDPDPNDVCNFHCLLQIEEPGRAFNRCVDACLRTEYPELAPKPYNVKKVGGPGAPSRNRRPGQKVAPGNGMPKKTTGTPKKVAPKKMPGGPRKAVPKKKPTSGVRKARPQAREYDDDLVARNDAALEEKLFDCQVPCAFSIPDTEGLKLFLCIKNCFDAPPKAKKSGPKSTPKTSAPKKTTGVMPKKKMTSGPARNGAPKKRPTTGNRKARDVEDDME
ncbi:hypothetical protein ONZ45_g15726 [Pleurotus djamor]|nr:hypothetical protein ONZ45_g15726 [Pleurotus djamor]